jgi:hypothetical protein
MVGALGNGAAAPAVPEAGKRYIEADAGDPHRVVQQI